MFLNTFFRGSGPFGRKTPFIVALNKVDRIYGWKPEAFNAIQLSLDKLGPDAASEFDSRVKESIAGFAENNLNACLYWVNTHPSFIYTVFVFVFFFSVFLFFCV